MFLKKIYTKKVVNLVILQHLDCSDNYITIIPIYFKLLVNLQDNI